MKKLKLFNGRYNDPRRNFNHINIAAYSKKQAAEILSTVSGYTYSSNEIYDYFSDVWGNSMNGIKPESPCAYLENNWGIIRVY